MTMTEINSNNQNFDFTTDPRPTLSISEIYVSETRARKEFSKLQELRSSIIKIGLLEPVVVTPITEHDRESDSAIKPHHTHKLLAGETRYRAMSIIPECRGRIAITLLHNLSAIRQKEIELEENIIRQNLSWQEESSLMLQIEELKRSLYGSISTMKSLDSNASSVNTTAWSLQKTADLFGKDINTASQQVRIAKKLRERPDLADKVKNLPMSAAARVIKLTEEGEKVERLHKTGQLELSTELLHTDALSFLKSRQSNSVDLFLTDPPFGLSSLKELEGEDTSETSNRSYTSQMTDTDNSSATQVLTLLHDILPEMYRVLKPSRHGYMFFDLELLGDIKQLIISSGFTIQWPVIIWAKNKPTVPFRGNNYASIYEAIFFFYKPGIISGSAKDSSDICRRLSKSAASIITCATTHASRKIHIFEKPSELLAGFIERSTQFGDVVCDPFAGSGSTLLTAKQLGRKAIGCEINGDTFLKAQSRLLQEGGVLLNDIETTLKTTTTTSTASIPIQT